MSKLLFRAARIRQADLREGKDGVFLKIGLTAAFTDVIREQMGWDHPGVVSGKLKGDLTATHFVLVPNDKELVQHTLELTANRIYDFKYTQIEEDGEVVGEDLNFAVDTNVEGASTYVETYMRRIGTSERSIGQLRVAYEEQLLLGCNTAAQPSLDGAEVEQPEDKGCIECNNSIPFMDGDPSMHASGQPCAAYEGGPAGPVLAPASLMGGTHQRKRGRPKTTDATGGTIN